MKKFFLTFWLTFSINGILWADVTLTWDHSPDVARITGYRMYQDGVSIGTVPATSNVFVVKNLMDGSTYSFKVTAYKDNIESAPSNTLVYTVPRATMKYKTRSIELTLSTNTDYILEATHDFNSWFEIQHVNSSASTTTVPIEEFNDNRFFRLKQNPPVLKMQVAMNLLRSVTHPVVSTEPPLPPKLKIWKRKARYDKAGASMGLK